MPILKENFSKLLREKRKELDLTIDGMAERCCISTRQYINLEQGKDEPKLKSFINIVLSCKIDTNQFVNNLVDNGYIVTDTLGEDNEK